MELQSIAGLERAKQTSESIELAIVLALSGGLMDAYSYLARGKVFANAQTGNMLLFGIAVADGDANQALRYFFPVLSFAVGVALAHYIKILTHERHMHWRQAALIVEIGLLCIVAFIPEDLNLLANSLTSLACGIQVQAFRKLHGHPFATTMCIGNLRSGTQHLVGYLHEHDRDMLTSALLYYGTIVTFVIGAVVGSRLVMATSLHAILASSALLLVGLILMFADREGSYFVEAEKRYDRLHRRQLKEHLDDLSFRNEIESEMRENLVGRIQSDVEEELQEQYAGELSPDTLHQVEQAIDTQVENVVNADIITEADQSGENRKTNGSDSGQSQHKDM